MLDRPASSASPHRGDALAQGVPDKDALLKFLAHRQFSYLAPEEEEDDEDDENFIQQDLARMSLGGGCAHVGHNGRWNKKADSCYCWWVSATLKVR